VERDMNAIHPGLECAVGNVTYEDALQRLLRLVPVPLPCRSVETAAYSGGVLAEAVVAFETCRDSISRPWTAMPSSLRMLQKSDFYR
jgi:hypothetical protein